MDLTALWIALALAAGAAGGSGEAPRFRVETSTAGCPLALEERATEPVLWLRPACPLGLTDTVDGLRALLRARFPAGRIDGPRSLSLGRIESFPWLSERLAAAARRSPEWDAQAGRPREGSPERFVGERLRSHALARELIDVLAGFGATAEIASVEKVLVREDANARLPYDAIVWLRLAPDRIGP